MSTGDHQHWIAGVEQHLPLIGYIVTGIAGVGATIIGYYKLRKLRLQKIEIAIGRRVLSGERRLATVHAMDACRDEMVDMMTRQFRALTEHIKDEGIQFSEIRDQTEHIHNRIDDLFKLLAETK